MNERVYVADVITATESVTQISAADIIGPRRSAAISMARHIGMSIAAEMTGRNCSEIARSFKRSDRTTVMVACSKIDHLRKIDQRIAQLVVGVRQEVSLMLEARRSGDEYLMEMVRLRMVARLPMPDIESDDWWSWNDARFRVGLYEASVAR
jgi:hypothetical protein